MKEISKFILEKLVYRQQVDEKLIISKDSKLKDKIKIDPKYVSESKIANLMFGFKPSPNNDPYKNLKKMEGYMKKGSKPLTLVHTIKNKEKLLNRWYAAIQLEWEEAIKVFGDEIEKRGYATLEELHGYILFKYIHYGKSEKMKKYLELYNIDYNAAN